MKEKVAWKVKNDFFVLDFSDIKAVKAYGPFGQANPTLQEVLFNPNAWLIIDGEYN